MNGFYLYYVHQDGSIEFLKYFKNTVVSDVEKLALIELMMRGLNHRSSFLVEK
jgi:hypothetical protein